ncbi:LCP family glycopolymer transferase [Sporosarcina aquimarina]|uniref:LCP family protein n=1 Tax=Sporosarcina aquimarina TaxID=114975 RepID=A0ABU4G142_9BACL|nr:LCP family protein [Sporosarcina aquimarina]MDW0110682.1 LCP family protein [Sporosarcina aquimarina]
MNGRKHNRLKWLWISMFVVLTMAAAGGIYISTIYNSVKATVNEVTHEPIQAISAVASKQKVEQRETLNILLLGVDEREGDRGRSDTMIVMTLNPTNSRMQMISIPRDTRTEIVGKGITDKINHAYAFGGNEMSVATVENFLDIDLDYYVRVNMDGLEQLVDAVGGITVTNERAFNLDEYSFKKGNIKLNGEQALAYVRMRKQDPEGDLGRNDRQRQVIQGVLNQGASMTSVTRIHKLIDILGKNMVTNMKFDDMQNLVTNYKSVRNELTTYQMTGDGKFIGDIWYLMVSDKEMGKVHEMIEEF